MKKEFFKLKEKEKIVDEKDRKKGETPIFLFFSLKRERENRVSKTIVPTFKLPLTAVD